MSRWKLAFVLWPILIVAGLFMVACDDSTDDDNGGSSGSFSVALASKANAAEVIATTGGGKDDTVVKGLAVNANSVKQAAGNALEVWLTDTTYVYSNGEPKEDVTSTETEKHYKVVWDAYTTLSNPPVTGDSLKVTAAAVDKVLIGKSATDGNAGNSDPATKPGRMKVQVGKTLLDAANTKPVYVVVSIYEPGTADADTKINVTDAAKLAKRLAQYKLTITKAEAIGLAGLGVTGKGGAAASLAAVSAVTATPSVPLGFAANSTTATVTLTLATPAANATSAVKFNTIKVTGTADWLEGKWTIEPATVAGNIVLTTVTGSPVDLADTVDATFTAASGKKGGVILTGTDKYGQSATITVTLDPNWT